MATPVLWKICIRRLRCSRWYLDIQPPGIRHTALNACVDHEGYQVEAGSRTRCSYFNDSQSITLGFRTPLEPSRFLHLNPWFIRIGPVTLRARHALFCPQKQVDLGSDIPWT